MLFVAMHTGHLFKPSSKFACLSFTEFHTASEKHSKGLGARLFYTCTNGCLALLSALGVYILTMLSGVMLR